jgi:DivIVA domain-containing protein
MGLTPHDIRTRQFKVGIRGFDSAEVRAFLEEAAEALEDECSRAEGPPPPDKLAGFVGESVAAVLRAADVASKEIIEEAERRASDLHAEATARAGELWAQAQHQVSEALGEAAAIRGEATQMVAEAREQNAATLEGFRLRERELADGWDKLRRSAARFSERVAAIKPAIDSVDVDEDLELWEGKESESEGKHSKVD